MPDPVELQSASSAPVVAGTQRATSAAAIESGNSSLSDPDGIALISQDKGKHRQAPAEAGQAAAQEQQAEIAALSPVAREVQNAMPGRLGAPTSETSSRHDEAETIRSITDEARLPVPPQVDPDADLEAQDARTRPSWVSRTFDSLSVVEASRLHDTREYLDGLRRLPVTMPNGSSGFFFEKLELTNAEMRKLSDGIARVGPAQVYLDGADRRLTKLADLADDAASALRADSNVWGRAAKLALTVPTYALTLATAFHGDTGSYKGLAFAGYSFTAAQAVEMLRNPTTTTASVVGNFNARQMQYAVNAGVYAYATWAPKGAPLQESPWLGSIAAVSQVVLTLGVEHGPDAWRWLRSGRAAAFKNDADRPREYKARLPGAIEDHKKLQTALDDYNQRFKSEGKKVGPTVATQRDSLENRIKDNYRALERLHNPLIQNHEINDDLGKKVVLTSVAAIVTGMDAFAVSSDHQALYDLAADAAVVSGVMLVGTYKPSVKISGLQDIYRDYLGTSTLAVIPTLVDHFMPQTFHYTKSTASGPETITAPGHAAQVTKNIIGVTAALTASNFAAGSEVGGWVAGGVSAISGVVAAASRSRSEAAPSVSGTTRPATSDSSPPSAGGAAQIQSSPMPPAASASSVLAPEATTHNTPHTTVPEDMTGAAPATRKDPEVPEPAREADVASVADVTTGAATAASSRVVEPGPKGGLPDANLLPGRSIIDPKGNAARYPSVTTTGEGTTTQGQPAPGTVLAPPTRASNTPEVLGQGEGGAAAARPTSPDARPAANPSHHAPDPGARELGPIDTTPRGLKPAAGAAGPLPASPGDSAGAQTGSAPDALPKTISTPSDQRVPQPPRGEPPRAAMTGIIVSPGLRSIPPLPPAADLSPQPTTKGATSARPGRSSGRPQKAGEASADVAAASRPVDSQHATGPGDTVTAPSRPGVGRDATVAQSRRVDATRAVPFSERRATATAVRGDGVPPQPATVGKQPGPRDTAADALPTTDARGATAPPRSAHLPAVESDGSKRTPASSSTQTFWPRTRARRATAAVDGADSVPTSATWSRRKEVDLHKAGPGRGSDLKPARPTPATPGRPTVTPSGVASRARSDQPTPSSAAATAARVAFMRAERRKQVGENPNDQEARIQEKRSKPPGWRKRLAEKLRSWRWAAGSPSPKPDAPRGIPMMRQTVPTKPDPASMTERARGFWKRKTATTSKATEPHKRLQKRHRRM